MCNRRRLIRLQVLQWGFWQFVSHQAINPFFHAKSSFVSALMSYSLCDNKTALVHLYLNDNVLERREGKNCSFCFLRVRSNVGFLLVFCLFVFLCGFFILGLPVLGYLVCTKYIPGYKLCVDCFCGQCGGTYGMGALLQELAS